MSDHHGKRTTPRPIRFLSEVTYSIYLFHLFFMYEAQRLFPHAAGSLEPAAVFEHGLADGHLEASRQFAQPPAPKLF